MIATDPLLNDWQTLLANATTIFADPANPPKIALAKNAFNPTPGILVADLVPADFDGYAPIPSGTGVQQSFIDPLTGSRVVQLKEPAGGWHWVTTGVTLLPQSIYGWYVTNQAGTIVLASSRFSNPIPLTAIGQGIDLAQVRFEMLPNALR